jgi:hypothetical protein
VHVDLTRDPERKMFGVLLSEEPIGPEDVGG